LESAQIDINDGTTGNQCIEMATLRGLVERSHRSTSRHSIATQTTHTSPGKTLAIFAAQNFSLLGA